MHQTGSTERRESPNLHDHNKMCRNSRELSTHKRSVVHAFKLPPAVGAFVVSERSVSLTSSAGTLAPGVLVYGSPFSLYFSYSACRPL